MLSWQKRYPFYTILPLVAVGPFLANNDKGHIE